MTGYELFSKRLDKRYEKERFGILSFILVTVSSRFYRMSLIGSQEIYEKDVEDGNKRETRSCRFQKERENS